MKLFLVQVSVYNDGYDNTPYIRTVAVTDSELKARDIGEEYAAKALEEAKANDAYDPYSYYTIMKRELNKPVELGV